MHYNARINCVFWVLTTVNRLSSTPVYEQNLAYGINLEDALPIFPQHSVQVQKTEPSKLHLLRRGHEDHIKVKLVTDWVPGMSALLLMDNNTKTRVTGHITCLHCWKGTSDWWLSSERAQDFIIAIFMDYPYSCPRLILLFSSPFCNFEFYFTILAFLPTSHFIYF